MQAFLRQDEGQGLVEYALIVAVIAIAVIVAMIFLRGQIQNIFKSIGNNLTELPFPESWLSDGGAPSKDLLSLSHDARAATL
jgi:pilus assembly protein Flp/PilA